ncbi:MAG TPA: ABC transporter ATP-binding protein [Candidatus Binataceae bacterium]|nr:ABC transporter ATP-binding protein [Candidatus Binataceae bacterium]
MGSLRLYGEVFRRMRVYGGRLVFVIVALVLASIIEAAKPWPLKIVIDNVLRGQPLAGSWIPPLSRSGLLIGSCLALVAVYLLVGVISIASNYVTISIGQRMVNDLRAQMFEHLQRLSLSFHRRREIGDLMVRIAYDSMSLQTIAMNGMFQILSALTMLAAMFYVMVRMDLTLTLAALAVVPILFTLIASVSRTIDRLSTSARVKESRLYTVAHQALAAIHVVQAFTREAESYKQFVESSSESLDETLKVYVFQTVYAGGVSVLIAAGTALVIYIGALHVLRGILTIGDLIVFTSYLASLYQPVNQIFQTYGLVENAKAGLRRCLELLEIEPEVMDRADARPLPAVRGEIEFEGVVFGYDPRSPVLKGVSFHANAGETIAIVGPSGAGKTTMASLLMRFYEPGRGTIRIDGRDTRDATLQSLRRNIAMVLQPPLVLGATMRANVALGNPAAGERQIVDAVTAARLAALVARLPNGIDELVGQGGHSLSEGEAQRVTIARALLKDAPILIMDEPTSALDTETESLVLAAVQAAMKGRTTLVIAHRLSTIQNADRILVLRDGVIVEQGTFAELLSRGGFFSYLYNLQAWHKQAVEA